MSTSRITTVALAVAVALATVAAALTVAPRASAKDGLRVSGTCTKGSTAKLKLSREDGRIEVEFEVDQNRNGVRWHVGLRRNGALVASTTARTRAPSGSFSVRRLIADGQGTDRVTAVARRASGERCTARASF